MDAYGCKFWICFFNSTVQLLLPIIGWRWIFGLIAILIIFSIIFILIAIPKCDQKNEINEENKNHTFSTIWKNKFFISVIPLGFFNYGGIMAIQTLWAGPWMLNVTGYNAFRAQQDYFG